MSVKIKQRLFLLIGVFFFGTLFFMFMSLTSQGFDDDFVEDTSDLQIRLLRELHQELDHHREVYNEVLLVLERFPEEDRTYVNGYLCPPLTKSQEKRKYAYIQSNFNNSAVLINERQGSYNSCPALPQEILGSDMTMLDVYEKLRFDNPDGGKWRQGFPIKTSEAEWSRKKLKDRICNIHQLEFDEVTAGLIKVEFSFFANDFVFVVPHSHNDPGWLKTVQKYFDDSTQHILNNIVDSLYNNPKRRFIWAEMSYLSMWWKIASLDRKVKMKALVDNGQLEMVTAGWVMTDEANTHYFAMIDQMIEGNEWLAHNLNVVPKNGWAIDPFGHSSTMSYILKKMGFENMVIQRVHYAVKKHLGLQKAFEFRWRQSWSSNQYTDMLCHMIPFRGYDVSSSCGPDPATCCLYDFARLLPNFRPCPVKYLRPSAITKQNIVEKSTILIDQYRKKSKLFRTNTLLVPLGDDFRYNTMKETLTQFENYEILFDYINSHPELHTEIQFGTLSEYFHEMRKETLGKLNKFPVLVGDFFTYADQNEDYWSGYYVSRPYHKMQDRILESHLRGAEILFSLALPTIKSSTERALFVKETYNLLVEARQNLGLFQHHDGITGTAKEHVVVDYSQKLMKSVMDSKKIQMLSAQALFSATLSGFNPSVMIFDYDEIYREHNRLPERHVFKFYFENQEVSVAVYNSLAYKRSGVVSFLVSTPNVVITSINGDVVPSQTNLLWKEGVKTETEKYEVFFVATVPALGLATYAIRRSSVNQSNKFSRTAIYNSLVLSQEEIAKKSPFQVAAPKTRKYLVLENDFIEAKFSPSSGHLQFLLNKITGVSTKISIHFVKYSTQWSGAYLFIPHGPAKLLVPSSFSPLIRLITGHIISEIHVQFPNLLHKISVYHGDGEGVQAYGLHVRNVVDVRKGFKNQEIAMRIVSDIQSGDKFYTDLNGFQMQERTTYSKLPLQGNFYPMPTMAFIQDSHKRLSVFTGQPLGVSSLKEGQLEMIMDRKLMQDDHRGLEQGVGDNVVTPETCVIALEDWSRKKKLPESLSYPSLTAHRMSWELLHPFRSMSLKTGQDVALKFHVSPLKQRTWPCDLRLLNLRSVQDRSKVEASDEVALLLHRVGYDCASGLDRCIMSNCGKYAFNHNSRISITSLIAVREVKKASLSLQKQSRRFYANATITIRPMEIEAFKIKF